VEGILTLNRLSSAEVVVGQVFALSLEYCLLLPLNLGLELLEDRLPSPFTLAHGNLLGDHVFGSFTPLLHPLLLRSFVN